MNKRAALIALVAMFTILTEPALSQSIVLKSFDQLVFKSAAMQGTDVSSYLRTMRGIMSRYTDQVYAVVMSNKGGMPDPSSVAGAANNTTLLANQIAGVKAPQEVAAEHKQLAMTLQQVDGFIKNNSGAGVQALPQALQLIASVQSTFSNYRNGTQNLIHKYGLPESLDPLSGDKNNGEKEQALNGMMGNMQGALLNGGTGGLGGLGGLGQPADSAWNPWGAAGSSSSSSGTPFGSGGSFGSSGSFNSGGAGMGSLLQGLDGSAGGGTTGGGTGGLDVNTIMQQMGDQNKVMQQLLGE
jgi:hypothetical protein